MCKVYKAYAKVSLMSTTKTDVTPAILSSDFVAQVETREKTASVTWRVARVFRGRATLFLRSILCYCAIKSRTRETKSCDKVAGVTSV